MLNIFVAMITSALAVNLRQLPEEHLVGIECPRTEPTDTDIVVRYNFFASEFGYYEIEGCRGASPHLILAADQEYTFIQSHISNWNHPLGFAYYPDGEDHSSKQDRRTWKQMLVEEWPTMFGIPVIAGALGIAMYRDFSYNGLY